MNKANQEKIFSSCPTIFRHRFDGPDKNLRWLGFRCGDGWFELILELSINLETIVKTQQIEHGLSGKYLPWVVQIKEKFGGLNYYMSAQNDEMRDLIHAAGQRSEKTCETCGKPGKTRNLDGWCYTECVPCCRARLNKLGV